MPKIKIDKELYERAKRAASEAGYSSLEELVTTILERELNLRESGDNDEDVLNRMKGLGYIS